MTVIFLGQETENFSSNCSPLARALPVEAIQFTDFGNEDGRENEGHMEDHVSSRGTDLFG